MSLPTAWVFTRPRVKWIAAPLRVRDSAVRLAFVDKLGWIKRLPEGLPHRQAVELVGRDCLTREVVLGDELDQGRLVGGLGLLKRGDDLREVALPRRS